MSLIIMNSSVQRCGPRKGVQINYRNVHSVRGKAYKQGTLPALRTRQQASDVFRRHASVLGSVDEDTISEQPPHHTEEIPEIPGNPARLATDILIGINVLMFILQITFPGVTMAGIKDNALISQGEVWRLLTPAFLHGSPIHLALNCASLASLGPLTEWTCGKERFLWIYMVSALTGSIASFVASDDLSLGASGAIFGLSGALAVYFFRNQKLFGSKGKNLQMRLWITILLNLGIGLALPQIDEWGHIGGLLGGGLVAYLLGPRYEVCRLKGLEGVWVVDDPPINIVSTPPRKVLK